MISKRKRSRLLCSSKSCNKNRLLQQSRSSTKQVVLDLRQQRDFDAVHIRESINSPLEGLDSETGDIFEDSKQIQLFWTKLRTKFSKETDILGLKKYSLLVICYDGETSRLATSILRSKDYTAYSVLGGFQAFGEYVKAR
jgi:rhodanese-related sulfurtransferase